MMAGKTQQMAKKELQTQKTHAVSETLQSQSQHDGNVSRRHSKTTHTPKPQNPKTPYR